MYLPSIEPNIPDTASLGDKTHAKPITGRHARRNSVGHDYCFIFSCSRRQVWDWCEVQPPVGIDQGRFLILEVESVIFLQYVTMYLSFLLSELAVLPPFSAEH